MESAPPDIKRKDMPPKFFNRRMIDVNGADGFELTVNRSDDPNCAPDQAARMT